MKVNAMILFALMITISCAENGEINDTNTEIVRGTRPDRPNDNPEDPIINNDNQGNDNSIINLPLTPFNYAEPNLPAHFNAGQVRSADNTPNNSISDEGATLGRVLFYDKNLSANRTISCASCHQANAGFSDNRRFSLGFDGGETGRNSMGLANARYYQNGHFFWDERANSLEDQVLMPIQDPVEMGMTMDEVVNRVSDLNYYDELFEDAFGTTNVSSDLIADGLSQFIRSMVSYNSKFDEGIAQAGPAAPGPGNQNRAFPNFTDEENLGMQIFMGRGGCARCHGTTVQIIDGAANNGLDRTTTDTGLGGVTNRAQDDGKFKVPSLRNVELTAPYMHDGRFNSLLRVVQFYNNEVQPHPNLDNRMTGNNGQPRRLNLNRQEQNALVAFMNTLTDTDFINDEKFSDPFN